MASTYLNRSVTTTQADSARYKFTVSFWIKCSEATPNTYIWQDYYSEAYRTFLKFNSGTIHFRSKNNSSDVVQLKSNQLFRDIHGWYHFVVVGDSTQATASDRVKIYVNGEQITSLSIATYINQNTGFEIANNSWSQQIGARNNSGSFSEHFSGSMSHFHYTESYAYAPTDFGETDATTGEWKIKTSPSITYGTNGFFILKDGNSVTDQSGNSNNFTVGGGTLTKTEDCPSNVFATLNPLDKYYGHIALTQGNNTFTQTLSSSSYAFVPSTLGFNSGKWYWEMKCVSGHSDNWYGTGITSSQCTANNNALGNNANDYALYGYSYGGGLASSYTNATRTNQGTTYTAGDILGCAVDCDNLAIYFSKNGVWMSNASNTQGVPTSGGSKTGSFFTIQAPSNTINGFYLPAACYYDARAAVQSFNFGNGYFGTTAVSSAGTNASGIGIFEYDVPTGFTALSTKGLNL